MNYSMTLSFNNQAEAIEFPVLPGKIEVSSSGGNKTYDINKLGEINVIGTQRLMEISFESFFPASWFPGCNVSAQELFEPKHYLDYIQRWRESKKPMRLVLVGSTFNINLPVSIERFVPSESGGAVGDIAYQISFKEYRFYAAKKVKVETSGASGTVTMPKLLSSPNKSARPDTRVQPKTYTLVAGDNLWKVAQKFLGNGARYNEIQKLNGIKDSELKRLPVGKVIKLP